jgi:hypothetical protein
MTYRRRKYGYAYRRIAMTERRFSIVDPQDFYWLNNFDWCAKTCFGHTYAIRFVDTPKRGSVMLSMHREIMKAPAGLLVDHRNGDTLDNRRDNLRLATHSQNQANKGKTSINTSSRFIGVHFRKRSGRWAATIRNEGKKVWLGSYKDEKEAARAYDEAAKKFHREFARLNFPESANSV